MRRLALAVALRLRQPPAADVHLNGWQHGRWGLAGICPGPGLILAGMGPQAGLAFVAAMLVGMGLFELAERLRQPRPVAARP
jgi:hypothetical protein